MHRPPLKTVLSALALAAPTQLLACAACFGRSDSRLAEGMNWGILTLLAVVGTVVLGLVALFVGHLRRASRLARTAAHDSLPAPTL